MTPYEHGMLGVTGGLATGLDRRYGWQLVALAGAAAMLPDWDGLSYFFGPTAFDRIHRFWGHTLWTAMLAGAIFAALDYRFGMLDRAGRWLLEKFPARRPDRPFAAGLQEELPAQGRNETPSVPSPTHHGKLWVWIVVGVIAASSHLAADLVFSGHAELSDWGLRLLWPWSERAWAYPMVPWGDTGVTILFVGGMFAMVRWPSRIQSIALATLAAVLAYIVLRIPLVGSF